MWEKCNPKFRTRPIFSVEIWLLTVFVQTFSRVLTGLARGDWRVAFCGKWDARNFWIFTKDFTLKIDQKQKVVTSKWFKKISQLSCSEVIEVLCYKINEMLHSFLKGDASEYLSPYLQIRVIDILMYVLVVY